MAIRGTVDAQGEARASLDLRDADGQIHPIAAVVDTGFNGQLTLPREAIQELNLAAAAPIVVTLATGTREVLNTWRGQIHWHDRLRTIRVLESRGNPLLGMGLLAGSQLTIQARVNGDVMIEELDETPP